jgi:hypothetical protein
MALSTPSIATPASHPSHVSNGLIQEVSYVGEHLFGSSQGTQRLTLPPTRALSPTPPPPPPSGRSGGMEWSLGPPWPPAKIGLLRHPALGSPTGAPPPPPPTPLGTRSGGGRPRPPAKGGGGGMGGCPRPPWPPAKVGPSWACGPSPTRVTLGGSAPITTSTRVQKWR